MIPFNKELIRFEYVKLKSVTAGGGGSLRIRDVEASKETETLITVRYDVPYAVARQYQKLHKPASYLVPVDACIVWYGDQIIAIEKRKIVVDHNSMGIDQTDLRGGNTWPADCEHNFNTRMLPLVMSSDRWFTDGIYAYELPDNLHTEIHNAERLTADGMFRGINVSALKFADMEHKQLIELPSTRSIVACVHSNGQVILTPPIWKNVSDVRKSGDSDLSNSDKKLGRFDLIEKNFNVNLEFALNAGKKVGAIFGYDQILPLKLDELMIHLCTVNLPKVPKSVRATFGISIPFLQAFAWVAGLTAKCESMSDFVKMRGLMKQLCTKGIFSSSLLKDVYKTENKEQPPALDKDQALEAVATIYNDSDHEVYWRTTMAKANKQAGDVDTSVLNAIGAMVD
jgi:hypothetical protein